ncbi:exostosin family protein [Genlisea aurea]|uniref:Exostosin family protein n=1 Tax=Genlisea aurea TaxID=192259 RepID=S8EHM5_9LAMI|nr:exostosin family protein [Genlisea aurea]
MKSRTPLSAGVENWESGSAVIGNILTVIRLRCLQMSAAKHSKLHIPASVCSLRGSIVSLAAVTLISFSCFSVKSLWFDSRLSLTTDRIADIAPPSVIKERAGSCADNLDNVSRLAEDADGGEFGEEDFVYHSPHVFKLNYDEMVKRFKVYIYPDGDPNTYYQTPRKLTGKYASEGYFFQNIRESGFVTDDAERADLFFIPISSHKMRGKGISYENMTIIVRDYVESLIHKYPYWNRTLGADHFFVTCHDVGVRATEGLPNLVKNSIRAVCSPSYDVGFIPHKDVALPQVLQPFALPSGGNDVENRTNLGFWAGHRNSRIRVILARVWENDTELDISNNRISRATGPLLYQKRFYRNKFCICPGGSQVNSARITDSIHYGCVPVIVSDYYDLPFNDVLNWRRFAVVVKEKDVYQLKQILKNITQQQFVSLHGSLVKVQKHFRWNSPPVKFDAFHMVMYELWLRRHVVRY